MSTQAAVAFSAPDLDDDWADNVDDVIIDAALGSIARFDDDGALVSEQTESYPTVAAMWRATRSSADDSAAIRLLELAPGTDPAAVLDRIQLEMAGRGIVSDIELFGPDTVLTSTLQDALAVASLIWVAEEPAWPTLATTFDGVDEQTGPFFRPDHARLAEPERTELLAFLQTGWRIVDSFGWLDDVVSGEPNCVPVGYSSDGIWIWPDASAYYLTHYGLAPDSGLCAHAAAHEKDAPTRPLSRLQLHLAFDVLTEPDSA